MNDETPRARTIRELHELVTALDRRIPQVHRVGEAGIARASAALREAAMARIEELEGAGARPGAELPGRKPDTP